MMPPPARQRVRLPVAPLVGAGVLWLGVVCGSVLAQADQPAKKDEAKPAAPAPAAPAQEAAKPGAEGAQPAPAAPKEPGYVLGYTMNGIDGKPVELSKYAGKVVMIVNVASKCGLTPQYEALQKLYKEHEAAGLVILGFPANNFMNQEPGSDGEILDFCKGKYNVTFPLFSKVSVKGSDAHPLFKQLAGLKPPAGGEPSWNFTKYLVDRRGIAVARFDPKVRPDDPELVKKLKTLLAEPAPKSSPAPAAGPAPAPASTPAPAPGK